VQQKGTAGARGASVMEYIAVKFTNPITLSSRECSRQWSFLVSFQVIHQNIDGTTVRDRSPESMTINTIAGQQRTVDLRDGWRRDDIHVESGKRWIALRESYVPSCPRTTFPCITANVPTCQRPARAICGHRIQSSEGVCMRWMGMACRGSRPAKRGELS